MRKNTINFTKTELAKLAPAEQGRRNCDYDSNMAGLELRVTDSGTKSFSVYKRVNGKSQRIVLGRYNPDAVQSPEFEKDPLSVLAWPLLKSIAPLAVPSNRCNLSLSMGVAAYHEGSNGLSFDR